MPEKKLEPLNIQFDVDVADIHSKEAEELCNYIADFLIKNYNVINWTYTIKGGE